MRVTVLVVDDVFDTGLATILDTFDTANALGGRKRFDVVVASPRSRVRTHHGLSVPVQPLPARTDLVVVPALACKEPATILAALTRPDVTQMANAIAEYARKSRIAGACTGTFVLGKSGVLGERRATTSWWLGPAFREAFPTVDLDENEMIVADDRVITAGAALAHVDLALALIRDQSPDLAATVAHYLLIDRRPSQGQFAVPSHVAHDDEIVKRFERWARGNLSVAFDLTSAAHAVGASERTLQRRIRAVLGRSPVGFMQDLRLEQARHLIATTQDSVDAIASAVGYVDASSLRTLLRRKQHTRIRDLRTRV
ncbi:MAG TPA: helix-turn-helix domain-containing protein [Kofleriaceae bacterium]|jgi:transcriptional regulator GlxA family with amidase domain